VYFQQRCMRKIRRMKQEGKTILFVSHDMGAVKNLCDAAVWLEHGAIKEIGEPDDVVGKYLAAMTLRRDPYAQELPKNMTAARAANASVAAPVVRSLPNVDHRWGNGHAEVIGIQLLDEAGFPCEKAEHGDQITTRISVAFHHDVACPIVGFMVRNRLGEDISGLNTSAEGLQLPPARAGQCFTVDFKLKLPLLAPGNYHFSPAVADGTHEEYVMCDWVENAVSLTLMKKTTVYGYMKFDCQVGLKYFG
jgi:lipopolysaccharide transport system ATP-binding protein